MSSTWKSGVSRLALLVTTSDEQRAIYAQFLANLAATIDHKWRSL